MTRATMLTKLRRLMGKMHEEGIISWPQVQMILRTMHLSELKVSDVCVPRSEIDGLSFSSPALEVRDTFLASGVSRLPVYDGSLDNIVGIVYARDWINLDIEEEYDLVGMCRQPVFVSETLPILDAMSVMRHKRVSIAICVDEHHGTRGLITIEDIIEEVFDEIEDEYDIEEPFILAEHPGETVLDAAMPLESFCQRYGLPLPDVPVDTVGGYITHEAGLIQKSGEQTETVLGLFQVLYADGRRLRRLKWLRQVEPDS